MARLPALVEAISQNDQRDEKLISHIARLTRDEGLIVSKGKGTAAAAMTFCDAATLLMAVGSARVAMDAPDGVRNLRSLRDLAPRDIDELDDQQSRFAQKELAFFSEPLHFAALLERMIENAPALATWEAEYLARTMAKKDGFTEEEFSVRRLIGLIDRQGDPIVPGFARPVRVLTYAPGVAAEVHLGWPWSAFGDREAIHRYFLPEPGGERLPDLLITFEIGTPTLLALHKAVVEPALNPRHMARNDVVG